MAHTRTLRMAIWAWVLSACVARTPLGPAPVDDATWFDGLDHVQDPLTPPMSATPPELTTYATLGALAKGEGWDGCESCRGDACPCFETRERVELGAGSAFSELRLLAHHGENECSWLLAARADERWLAPLQLGTSPRGCVRPVSSEMLETFGDWWYPLAFDADPAQRVVRLEGEGRPFAELYRGGGDVVAPRAIDRVVVLCRVDARTLACSTRSAQARVITGAMRDPLSREWTELLATDRAFASLDDAERVGRDWDAQWLVAPKAEVERALLRVGSGTMQRVPLGGGRDVVVVAGENRVQLLLVRGAEVGLAAWATDPLANGACRLEGVARAPGVVRVSESRTIDGGAKGVTIAWRWEDLFVARPTPRQFRILTGISLTRDGRPLATWRRDVVLEDGGLRLVEGPGALAWFRGTGRFSWDALAAQIPRWRGAMARALREAWKAESTTRPAPPPEGRDDDDGVGWLRVLPGFVEPLSEVFPDEVTVLE